MKEQLNSLLNQFLQLKEKTEEEIQKGTFQFISPAERSEILKNLKNLKSKIRILISRFKIGIAAGLLSLSLITFSVSQLNAKTSPVKAASLSGYSFSDNTPGGILKAGSEVLYSQFDNFSGNGVPSQNFETAYDVYDCDAADDFTVPGGKVWTVDEIEVAYSYNVLTSPPSPTNLTVRFYNDNAGRPGILIKEFVGFNVPSATFITGAIPLPAPVILESGVKWVSFHENLNFSPSGQIYWSNRSVQSGYESCWINPGDGFSTGATTWTPQRTAGVGGGASPDLIFGIVGVESQAVPFPLIGSILAFLGIGGASLFGLRKRKK
jgi:hypothetical protein